MFLLSLVSLVMCMPCPLRMGKCGDASAVEQLLPTLAVVHAGSIDTGNAPRHTFLLSESESGITCWCSQFASVDQILSPNMASPLSSPASLYNTTISTACLPFLPSTAEAAPWRARFSTPPRCASPSLLYHQATPWRARFFLLLHSSAAPCAVRS